MKNHDHRELVWDPGGGEELQHVLHYLPVVATEQDQVQRYLVSSFRVFCTISSVSLGQVSWFYEHLVDLLHTPCQGHPDQAELSRHNTSLSCLAEHISVEAFIFYLLIHQGSVHLALESSS